MPETPPTTTPHSAEGWVDLLKTLADPIRLRIVRLLEQQAHHGLSVGELADILKLPQSTVSRHLKTLSDAHLAAVRREGTSMLYRLAETANVNGIKQLRTLSRQQLDADPQARTDAQRLAMILRQRAADSEKFFGKSAPLWDQIREEWFGSTFHLEAMLALLDPTWTVADIGTGTGAMLPLLAPHVARVIGVEPSAAMLRTAQARLRDLRLSNVELRAGSLEDLPLDKHSVDVALLALVLHHVAEPPIALAELARALRPGGVLLIVDLQPHDVALFREKMHHRWMGFAKVQLESWLTDAGFVRPRWHPLPARQSRTKDNGTVVPDLFTLRAEAPA